jgi:tripartite-type tricarboxylate transporter receptor subunit TctC
MLGLTRHRCPRSWRSSLRVAKMSTRGACAITWLKANQDKVTVETSGVGGGSHIAGVFFQNAIAARFQFVPYRGAGPAMNDLVAGQIDLMVDASPDCLPHLRAGAIKAYAVMAQARLAIPHRAQSDAC